jgi:hypothetical protein
MTQQKLTKDEIIKYATDRKLETIYGVGNDGETDGESDFKIKVKTKKDNIILKIYNIFNGVKTIQNFEDVDIYELSTTKPITSCECNCNCKNDRNYKMSDFFDDLKTKTAVLEKIKTNTTINTTGLDKVHNIKKRYTDK